MNAPNSRRSHHTARFASLPALLLAGACWAQQPAAESTAIDVQPLRQGVYLLAASPTAPNTVIQVGDDGVLVIDTMGTGMGETLLKAIRGVTDKPIRYVLNTSANPDQVGGNEAIAKAGSTLAGGAMLGAIEDVKASAQILAHENALTIMSTREPPPPFDGWPTSTYFTSHKDVHFNGEPVQLVHQPNASTNGDSIVVLERSDVIVAGQLFSMEGYPFIDVKNGGSLKGTIAALNRIIERTVPVWMQEGGTMVVPAYGRACDESEVVEYRDMLTIVRDQIQELIREGRSMEQVVKAQPTLGYDPRYGRDSGAWTTRMFVETVYRELKGTRGQTARR